MPVYFMFLFSSKGIPTGHLEGFVTIFAYNRLFPLQDRKKTQETKSCDQFENRRSVDSSSSFGLVLYLDVSKMKCIPFYIYI
jgi:hypothetical protein